MSNDLNEKPSLPTEGSFYIRHVIDAFAHSGLYTIFNATGQLDLCRDMSDASGMPMGSRMINMYPPGSLVLVYEPKDQSPIILGALSPMVTDAKLALPDWIGLCSRVGAWEDPLHSDPIADNTQGLFNSSGGRPIDCLPGDWGRINDLGAAIFLGRMMSMLRASDGAQIQAFWGDDLLRVIGYNYELFTAGSEERKINDQGEYQEIYRSSPFPWEALGKGGAKGATHTSSKSQPTEPGMTYSEVEPKEDDQLIVPRHMIVRGYLGDIEREFVCLPPVGLDISRYQTMDKYLGLMDISKHIDGSYSVRSAKQITLEKYVLLPVPKELIAPEDPLGDDETNYKFAGVEGSGEDHKMQEFDWAEDKPGIRAQQLWDYHAYFFGKYVQQGLMQHEKDWYLPEENAMSGMADRASVLPATVNMGHKFYADMVSPVELKIDERSSHMVKFYATRSVIKQCDDGSILLEDGCGSQIRMEGGNIFITCPGDVWTLPGRNAITWAPHDVIQRAGNSADISAAKKDVRIKAEQNLHMLAANKKTGSILLECRGNGMPSLSAFKDKLGEAVTGSGIFIKAPKTSIALWGQRIYAGGSEKIRGKQIVLDAGREGSVFLRGNMIESQADASVVSAVGTLGKNTSFMSLGRSSLATDAENILLGGNTSIMKKDKDVSVQIVGNVILHRQLVVDGAVVSNKGFAAYKQSQVAPREQKIKMPDVKPYTELIQTLKNMVDLSAVAKQKIFFKGSDALGDVPMSQAVGFSCRRTVQDLKLEQGSFVIRAARWQTLIKLGGGSNTWDEPEVPYPDADGGQKTFPHPGKEGWKDWGGAFSMLDDGKNFSPTTGVPVQRSGLSEDGQEPVKKKFEKNYVINVQQ